MHCYLGTNRPFDTEPHEGRAQDPLRICVVEVILSCSQTHVHTEDRGAALCGPEYCLMRAIQALAVSRRECGLDVVPFTYRRAVRMHSSTHKTVAGWAIGCLELRPTKHANRASLIAQLVKNAPAMQETPVREGIGSPLQYP